MEPAIVLGVEEAPNVDATDDFDPLAGVVVDVELDIPPAPPETELVVVGWLLWLLLGVITQFMP